MFIFVIRCLLAIFIVYKSNVVFAHEVAFGSSCSLKSSCINGNHENNVENVMCYESKECTVVGQESAYTGYSHYKLYKIGLKTVQIKQENEHLWINFIFTSQIIIKNDSQGNLSSFILKIFLEQDKMQICYNFVVPFSSLHLNENIFSLPCFKFPNHLTDHLNIHVAVYYKSSSGSTEILILKQQMQILLAKNSLLDHELSKLKKYLQLEEISQAFNTTEVQNFKIFTLKSCHLFENDKFRFSFTVTNLDCLLFYNVSAHSSLGKNICNFGGLQQFSTSYNPRVMINCSKKQFNSYETYSTNVSLIASKKCKSKIPLKFSEAVFFDYWPEDFMFRAHDSVCQNWNATAVIVGNSLKKSISIIFEPHCGFESCFQTFEIYLYKLYSDKCQPFNGILIDTFEVAAVYNQKAMAVFENLRNGCYALLSVPCTLDMCFSEWSIGFEKTIYISNKDHEENIITTVEKLTDHEKLIFAVITVVFIITVLSGFVLLFHRKCKQSVLKKKYGSMGFRKGSNEDLELISTTSENRICSKDIQIFILYSHEKQNRENVHNLVDFLRQCGYEVILDDDFIEYLCTDPSSWRDEVLKHTCTKTGSTCNSNKKYILVESEGAVDFIEYRREILRNPAEVDLEFKDKESDIESVEYENEEKWFQSTLTSISIDWKLCFQDYCHLFVVYFDGSICPERGLNILPNVRFEISKDLENLCKNLDVSLNSGNSPNKQKLEKCLKYHPIMHQSLQNKFV